MQPRQTDDRPPKERLEDMNQRLAAAEHEAGALESERRQYLAGLLKDFMTASVAFELGIPESRLLDWAGQAPRRTTDEEDRDLTSVIREKLNPKHYQGQTEYVTCTNAFLALVQYVESLPCECQDGGNMAKTCLRCSVLGRTFNEKIDRGEPPVIQKVDQRG